MSETKTYPSEIETKAQPAAPAKAAVKPATKPQTKSIDLVNPVEIPKLETPPQQPSVQSAEKEQSPLVAFSNFLANAPKEHLPTMMVRIANKCLAEKVFATPGAMAEAIVGASKK